MSDIWDSVRDWWESDSHFRQQIILAFIVGMIGLTFAVIQAKAVATWE